MNKSKKNSLADRLKKVFFHADGKSLNRERLVKAGSVLACVVAFTTTYALILPAVTLEGTPRCGQEEHVHTEACYQAQDAGAAGQFETLSTKAAQSDTAEATGGEPVCGQEEHKHTLACFSDPEADTDASGWEQAADRAVSGLSDDAAKIPAERVLAVAQSQKGYRESGKNYQVLEDGKTKRGFTIYGNAYGTPYDDWSTLFVKWCIDRAGVEDFLFETDCSTWAEALQAQGGLWKTVDPKAGDLIFLDLGDTGKANQVGIIERVETSRNGAKTTLHVIEGNSGDRVQLMSYASSDGRILGYAVIPADLPLNPDVTGDASHADADANEDAQAADDTDANVDTDTQTQTTGDADVSDGADSDANVQDPSNAYNDANDGNADGDTNTETRTNDGDTDVQNDSDKEQAADITDAQNSTDENDGADPAAQNVDDENNPASDENEDHENMTTDPSDPSDAQDANQNGTASGDEAADPADPSATEASAENDDTQTGDSTRNHEAADAADSEGSADEAVDDNPTSETDDAAIEALKDAQKGKSVFEKISDTIKDLLTPSVRKEVSVGDVSVMVEYNEGVLPADVLVDVVSVDADAYTDVISETTGLENPVVHAFDVKFLSNGREVEPDGVVTVTFEADYIKASTEPEVVHISDDGVGERIDTRVADGELTLNADSFSVYAIVYTVDFEHGGYQYHMNGGESISLRSLFSQLEIDRSVDDVQSVSFSNEKLIAVSQDDNGEWILQSLKPFQTEETLTVVLEDGTSTEITVTDEQGDAQGLDLDGKSFAIVNRKGNTNYALSTTASGNLLKNVTLSAFDDNAKTCSDNAPNWKFEHLEDNKYLVHYGEYYLQINQGSISVVSDRDTAEANPVIITKNDAGKYRFTGQNSNGYALNNYGNSGFGPWNGSNADEYMTLCAPKTVDNQTGKKGTIDTVDTRSKGIKINLFDYGTDRLDDVGNTYKSQDNSGINSYGSLKFYAYGTDGSGINNFTGGATAHQGIVNSSLTNGFPAIKNESLDYLFNTNNIANGVKTVYRDVNHLFKDENGYFKYDSDVNYAYYDTAQGSSGDFKVYNSTYHEEGADNKDFWIGFFPFNDYDQRYQCIHGDNFRWGCKGQRNGPSDAVGHYNHHFGMTMEGEFIMPSDKKVNGDDMIFEFSGDDDMWVFIDGVLVLDIGGIHNPVDGKINFTTGDVTVSNARAATGGGVDNEGYSSYLGANTTIEQAFRKAGKEWNPDPLVEHEIKVFYMERGGMYSNCEITFNLQTIEERQDIEFEKIDAANANIKLKDAKFKLYSDPECTKEVKDIAGKAIEGISDENGKVRFTDLVKDAKFVYYMKEVESGKNPSNASDEYQLNPSVFVINIPPNDGRPQIYEYGADPATAVSQVKNIKKVNAKASFYKVEEHEAGVSPSDYKYLKGAVFALYSDPDCKIPVKKNDTNVTATAEDGLVQFTDLDVDAVYYFKEIATPPADQNDGESYIISTDVYRIVVDIEGKSKIYLGDDEVETITTMDQNDPQNGAYQIQNKPKNDKTSVSVKKDWSDGKDKHDNDSVTVGLYRLVEPTEMVSINLHVDEWSGTETAPENGTIPYTIKYSDDTIARNGSLSYNSSEDLRWKATELLPKKRNNSDETYTVIIGQVGSPLTEAQIKSDTVDASGNHDVAIKGTVGGQNTKDNATLTVKFKGKKPESDFNINLTSFFSYIREGDTWKKIAVINNDENYVNNKFNNIRMKKDDITDKKFEGELPKKKNGDLIYYGFTVKADQLPTGVDSYSVVCSPNWDSNPSSISGNSEVTFYIPAKADNLEIIVSFPSLNTLEGASIPTKSTFEPSSFAMPGYTGMAKARVSLGENSPKFANGTSLVLPAGCEKVKWTDIGKTGDGEYAVVTLSKDNGWAYTWDKLPKTTKDDYGNDRNITYFVKEESVDIDDTNIDFIGADYTYDPVDPASTGVTLAEIMNTVYPTMSLEVRKEWYQNNGTATYIPKNDDEKTIEYEVWQHAEGRDSDVKMGGTRYLKYADDAWKMDAPVTGLPTKVNVNGTLRDATYYVKETKTGYNQQLTTLYRNSKGELVNDPESTATGQDGATQTIVNVNGENKIRVTKKWWYREKGAAIDRDNRWKTQTEVTKPETTEVYFKLAEMNSDVEEHPQTPTYFDSGKVFTLKWTSQEGWSTVEFTDLDQNKKYYIVETDKSGNPIKVDASSSIVEIYQTDINDREIDDFSGGTPGIYTINNVQETTGLNVEKIWWGINKENLMEGKEVGFKLWRAESEDGGQTYKAGTQKCIAEFTMDSSSWSRRFDNLPVAAVKNGTSGSSLVYYWYYVEEIGVRTKAGDSGQDVGNYSPVSNMSVTYQSKGKGTANPQEYASYDQGTSTVGADETKVAVWDSNYDGTGTLGIFNKTEEFLQTDLNINKKWKGLDTDGSWKEGAFGDTLSNMEIELQLIQIAKFDDKTEEAKYGSSFIVDKNNVVRPSDAFVVQCTGSDWSFRIPAKLSPESNVFQLPLKGPFTDSAGNIHSNAEFTYKIVEADVYNGTKVVSEDWNTSYQVSKGMGDYNSYDVSFEVDNLKKYRIELQKTDNATPTLKPITGAKFRLQRENNSAWENVDFSAAVNDGTNTQLKIENGEFTIEDLKGIIIENLPTGTYRLEELSSPDGYNKMATPLKFKIQEDGKFVMDASNQTKYYAITYPGVTANAPDATKIQVKNEPGAELPSTGGAGTGWFYGAGGVLALLAGSGLIWMRRRRSAVKQG